MLLRQEKLSTESCQEQQKTSQSQGFGQGFFNFFIFSINELKKILLVLFIVVSYLQGSNYTSRLNSCINQH